MTKSTLTITKPSRSGVALEGDERFETAVILASTSPLGITAMGAFPVSLIALGQIRRRHFDDTLTLRPKRTTNATEELESPQKIEIAALTEPIETTEPGARANPPPIMKHCTSEHLINLSNMKDAWWKEASSIPAVSVTATATCAGSYVFSENLKRVHTLFRERELLSALFTGLSCTSVYK